MNTRKMIADINTTVEALMAEKSSLLDRIKSIDDNITAYRMAIESLELTIGQHAPVAEPHVAKPERVKPHYSNATRVEFSGRTQKLSAWASEYGIPVNALVFRLNSGWPIEDAITRPKAQGKPLQNRRSRKVFAYDPKGNVIRQYVNVGDAAKDLKLTKEVVEKMLTDISVADQLASRNYYLAYAV